MNNEAHEALALALRKSDLSRQQMIAIYASVMQVLEDTEDNDVLRDYFAKRFGTYGLEGLDSLR